MNKKYVFLLSHATERPFEVIVQMKTATNMKAFDEEAEICFFLMGEAVQLVKKGIAETITAELEGKKIVVSEMLQTLLEDFGCKFYVCHAFLPSYGITEENLVEGAELKSSSYLGELLLDGWIPLSLNL